MVFILLVLLLLVSAVSAVFVSESDPMLVVVMTLKVSKVKSGSDNVRQNELCNKSAREGVQEQHTTAQQQMSAKILRLACTDTEREKRRGERREEWPTLSAAAQNVQCTSVTAPFIAATAAVQGRWYD